MIKVIDYHNNVIESPFVPINYAFVNSNIVPSEYKFIAIQSAAYTVIRTDKITDAYIHTNGPIIAVKPIQKIVAFNVSDIAVKVAIEITGSTSSEIEMQQANNEIYLALSSLCLVHKQVFETAHFKCIVNAPTHTSYFIANKTTKLEIMESKYKLYNNVQKVTNHKINIYCDVKLASKSTTRYTMLNVEEIKRNALFKLNPVYVGKHLLLESSNKTAFEVVITNLSCPLSNDSICFLSDYEFSFVSLDPTIVIYSPATIHAPIMFEIDLLEITNNSMPSSSIPSSSIPSSPILSSPILSSSNPVIYKMDDITNSILQLFSMPTIIKVEDIYEILVNNTMLRIKIKTIHTAVSKSATICYYNPPLNIVFGICSNYQKHIYVMKEPSITNIQLLEIRVKCNVELDPMAIKKAILDIQNIMSPNLNKPIQLTIADTKLEATIISIQTESDFVSTLLHMNDQTEINLQIEYEHVKPHIALTREDLKNIKTQLESYGMSGMDEQIRVLTKELFLPRASFVPKELVNILRPTRGVILYGPPGTGKTTLARNIGSLLHIPADDVKMITATEILNKFIGESEENIRGLFEPARKNPHKVHLLIIDEMDAILGSRKGQTELRNSIVNQFLGEMDGLNQISNILIIGITNRLDMLDSAVLRPGRFSCLIKCDLPNIHSRKQIIQLYIHKLQVANIAMDEFLLDELAEKTDGFSCADIEYIFNCLIDQLTEHLFETECVLHITRQHMLDTIEQIKCRTQST
jgi:hypothetical protein